MFKFTGVYLSIALMLTGAAAQGAPEPPCLQACKDQCYIDKDCPSFKKPQNCIDRCDSNCVDKIARQGCGGTDAPTPEPTKPPVNGIPVCLGSCVGTCEIKKACKPGDPKCNKRCVDYCLKLYDKKGCPTSSPTFAPLPGVPACIGPCIKDCSDKKNCYAYKKPKKCIKRCQKSCLKIYDRQGCPTGSPPTPAPYTNPPVLGTFGCNTLVKSGGQQSQDYKIVFTGTVQKGFIEIYYNMYTIPDEMQVIYEGKTLFTTGGLVSKSLTTTVFIDGTENYAIVRLNAPLPNTGWRFIVGCTQ